MLIFFYRYIFYLRVHLFQVERALGTKKRTALRILGKDVDYTPDTDDNANCQCVKNNGKINMILYQHLLYLKRSIVTIYTSHKNDRPP